VRNKIVLAVKRITAVATSCPPALRTTLTPKPSALVWASDSDAALLCAISECLGWKMVFSRKNGASAWAA